MIRPALRTSVTWLLLAAALPAPTQTMPTLRPTQACVFSAVKARVVRGDQPLAGVTVVRRWEWQQAGEDRATTDPDGWFSLPAGFASSWTRLLPLEFVVGQSMDVVVDGQVQSIWSFAKREPAVDAELGGRPLVLRCDLTRATETRRVSGAILSTLCVPE